MKIKSATLLRGEALAVVGLGQIGGSILQRLSRLRPSIDLIAHDRDRRLSSVAKRHARWITNLHEVVHSSNIMILSVPVPAIQSLLEEIGSEVAHTKRERRLLVLDTGTLKSAIVKHAAKYRRHFDFVGLHPLAGHEGEGWNSSDPALFEGKLIVHTHSGTSQRPVVLELIRLLGGAPLAMQSDVHDRLVAESIGLPHLLAFAAQGMSRNNPLRVASWTSLTRVAASNPEMVGGFLTGNRTALKQALKRFNRELSSLTRALDDSTGRALIRELSRRRRSGN